MKNTYSPDILNCLANLSSDEVFTSPELANRMLDLLPQELFRSSKTRFLDPCSKSGVFLREIAKRLLAGLEEQIPDLQQRIDHIMTMQVFGIACTDLTAEMSRRTLYCTKQANGEYSVATCFDDAQGNLRYMRCQHTWENGKCKHCGANRAQYDRVETIESYAYPFIHKPIKEILKKDMQFDVIIGNPPYQMSDGGNSASAMPIYQHFVQQAKKLKPRFLIMITPSRWFAGGRGLDAYREEMLNDNRIEKIVDYADSQDCFPAVIIGGGVSYFLWNREYHGKCTVVNIAKEIKSETQRCLNEYPVFVRSNEAINIIHKLGLFTSLSSIVLPSNPFGFRTFIRGESKPSLDSIALINSEGVGYVKRSDVLKNIDAIDKFNVILTRAMSGGNKPMSDGKYQIIPSTMKVMNAGEICAETYICIGKFSNKKEADNLVSYLKTNFCRFMMLQAMTSIMINKDVFRFVPLQDFSHPWTDEMLYKKYNLDEDEISFIESMIRPME